MILLDFVGEWFYIKVTVLEMFKYTELLLLFMDTQIIELLGRNILITRLLRADLEVAIPQRDKGIDLIMYVDKERFHAIPIQMKASIGEMFSLDAKYAKFPTMIIAYVWHVDNANLTETYFLTYDEAFSIAEQMRWTTTASWKKGNYVTTNPSKKLMGLLEPYKMNTSKLRTLFNSV